MEEKALVPSPVSLDKEYANSEEPMVAEDSPKEGLDEKVVGIIPYIEEKYSQSKTAKLPDEQRAAEAYGNYRGIYGNSVQFTTHEKSKVFVKVTKGKVLAAYGQLCDILFGSDKFPIEVRPTPKPDGISETVHFAGKQPPAPQPQAGQPGATPSPTPVEPQEPPELKPGETLRDFQERVGSLSKQLEPVKDKLKEGPGQTPGDITIHPAALSAEKMNKTFNDQLEESGARRELRLSVFEACLLGTGIMQGPSGVDKEYPRWDEKGEYKPVTKFVPYYEHVSFWEAYPDPDADSIDQCSYFIRRRKLSRSNLRALKKRPHFRANAIDTAIQYGENYVEEWWETTLEEEGDNASHANPDRFEVLEFWGTVDVDLLQDQKIALPKEARDLGEVQVNAWICNGQVLRLVLNPHKPAYLPFFVFPYELNPYSFFGIGVAENMSDTQLLMNGFMRMAVDNAALAGNLVFEIDKDNLVPGQDLEIYPGKVFVRQAGAPGQALFSQKFNNTANENMQMFDKARQLSDEQTGIPSFSHGQTGVSGVGRTSSGISMLMGAASGSIKTVIKNIDEYALEPMGKSLFRFNMQFNFDPEIKGDLEIKARGTESYIANEVRSQRLMQFLQITQNPQDAPFARRDYILREIAKSLELDPEKVVNNMADAAIQAEMIAKMQAKMTPPEPPNAPQSQSTGAPALPAVSDTGGNGNANIGTGQAPTPGEQGFSGNAPLGPQV